MSGSHGMCLDCMLLGVKVTTKLEFFCIQVIQVIVKIVTPCFNLPCMQVPSGIVNKEMCHILCKKTDTTYSLVYVKALLRMLYAI